MLVDLSVRDLGVIGSLEVELGPGMTALTGETGAGKTLIVEALGLLAGARGDPLLVRPGAKEALVEGRFAFARGECPQALADLVTEDNELVLSRSLAQGRSRAWINGRMAPLAQLSEVCTVLVELNGQHGHQALRSAAAQREALDSFGSVDHSGERKLREEISRLRGELSGLGGDGREMARRADLLGYQIAEIEAAQLQDPEEDEALEAEEELLASAGQRREAALAALLALSGSENIDSFRAHGAPSSQGRRAVPPGSSGTSVTDALSSAKISLSESGLEDLSDRLEAVVAESVDIARELRGRVELLEEDPARLEEVRGRRRLLAELKRKYGESLRDVISFGESARREANELASREHRASELQGALEEAAGMLAAEEAAILEARRRAAPLLESAVEDRLRFVGMGRARLVVTVGDGDGGHAEVTFLLGANPGEPALPLSRVASGGELSRAMLALRLVLSSSPSTVVFDEVDSGIGGEAAIAVGRALSEVSEGRQVLVVTHLAQVAARATSQVVVEKEEVGGRTHAAARVVSGEDRLAELARMLSGRPDSDSGREHARELLCAASEEGRTLGGQEVH